MNPNITEGLSDEQIQKFDADSIEKLIKDYEKTKKLVSFDIDGDSDMTMEEIEIFNKIEGTSNIIENLYSLLNKVKKIDKKEKSWTEALFGNNDTISSKDINEYNKEEAIKVLTYLNKNYKSYNDAFSKTAEKLAENISSTDSLNDIDNKAEVNIFQQKLINKIIGNNKGYSSEYLQGFNNEKGNFIEDIQSFQTNLPKINIKNLNSHLLVNFFKFLTESHKLNIKEIQNIFGIENLTKLKKYWNSDKNNNIAKNYLIENGLLYIIEIMNNNMDYYASLSPEELNEKLKIVKDKKERTKIEISIKKIQIEEKIGILKKLKYDEIELQKLENNYNKKNISNSLNLLNDFNDTLSKRIGGVLEEKEKTNGTNLLDKLGIDFDIVDSEENEAYYNITKEELINKLVKEKNINKVILILKEIRESHIMYLENNVSLIDTSLIDLYINEVTNTSISKNDFKQVYTIINNLDLFRSQSLCPKSETVINLKKATIESNTIQNKIKRSIDNLYPKGKDMGNKLINIINNKLDKAKEGKGYCTIEIIKIIEEFDNQNRQYKQNPDKLLSNNEIKGIIEGIMEKKEEESDNIITNIFIKAGIQFKEKKSENGSFNNIEVLSDLNEESIRLLPNITKEEKEILIKELTKLKGRQKIKNNIDKYSDEELNEIRQAIQEGKDPFEIQKEIETKRKQEENNKQTHSNKGESENIVSTTEYSYIKTENGYHLKSENGKIVQGLVISEEEKKITLGNPEATENLIKFYEFFKELNLESVWKYRKELMISMGNRNINFVDNDSLSKSELVQFGNNLILSLNNLSTKNKDLKSKPKLLVTNSLSGVQNELRKFSGASSVLSDEKTHNIKGEDKFAATLRSFGIIGGAYFKINTFREQIKK